MVQCICDPEIMNGFRYVQWIGSVFSVCAYSTRDVIAFIAGLTNIFFWLFAQAPQIYLNYKNKSGEALSLPFLLIWLCGDILNLFGALYTLQYGVVLITAIYFIAVDVVLLGQVFYYNVFGFGQPKKEKTVEDEREEQLVDEENDRISFVDQENQIRNSGVGRKSTTLFSAGIVLFSIGYFGNLFQDVISPELLPKNLSLHLSNATAIASATFSSLTASSSIHISSQYIDASFKIGDITTTLSTPINDSNSTFKLKDEKQPICDDNGELSDGAYLFGVISAWGCGALYVTSRIPQILKNRRRKSVENLSIPLFTFPIVANFLYGFSILFPTTTDFDSSDFWEGSFPYLIGSLGTNIFGFVIVYQLYKYRGNVYVPEGEEAENGQPDEVGINTSSTRRQQQSGVVITAEDSANQALSSHSKFGKSDDDFTATQ